MGIKGLTALIHEHAPKAFKEHEIKTLFGRKVAVDASMSIYQFLIAVRQRDGEMLMNEQGETTSHLMGFFYRTIRMVENGIKPAYVFDGKPPQLKSGVLAKRFERRKEATEQGEEAKEVGTTEEVDKLSRRTVRVTKEHNEECRKLLKLMGIPCIVAPSEAEAQCAELARGGKVYGAGSEDMDTLTFNSPILLRHLTFSEAKKAPISEVDLKKVLDGLEMNMSQFIDLCILLGCDYLEPIKGVGPKSALKLLREHGSLGPIVKHLREKQAEREGVAAQAIVEEPESEEEEEEHVATEHELESEDEAEEEPKPSKQKSNKRRIEDSEDEDGDKPMKDPSSDAPREEDSPKAKGKGKAKAASATKGKGKAKAKNGSSPTKPIKPKGKGGITVPEYWPWEEAKELFLKPDVTPADQLELIWEEPNVEGLVEFLVRDKGFNEDRVRKGAEKLSKMLNAKQQGRLDGFFTSKPKEDKDKNPSKGGKSGKDGKATGKASGTKRKADEKKEANTSKKGKVAKK